MRAHTAMHDPDPTLKNELERLAEHPGAILQRELKRRKMSVTRAAPLVGISRVSLSTLLNGHCGVSPHTAVKLEAFSGVPAEVWMQAQARFDLADVRRGNIQ